MGIQDLGLRILQVVALTLPAIALYLVVLTEVYTNIKKESGLEPTGVASVTNAGQKTDFAGALLSFIIHLFSSIIIALAIVAREILVLQLGILILIVGFGTLLVAVSITLRRSIKLIRQSYI